MIGLIGMNALD
jgi:hypothetical protein